MEDTHPDDGEQGHRPHGVALRKGRVSMPGATYAVQFCTNDRRPLLWGGMSLHEVIRDGYCAESVSSAVIQPLLWLRDQGYVKVGGFVVMPDHVHAIIGLVGDKTLSEVMQSWKRRSARAVNAKLRRRGVLWHEGYYDHIFRAPKVYGATLAYIHENVSRKFPEADTSAFPYSSAHPHWESCLDWDWFTNFPL